jgi:hypothetical protein
VRKGVIAMMMMTYNHYPPTVEFDQDYDTGSFQYPGQALPEGYVLTTNVIPEWDDVGTVAARHSLLTKADSRALSAAANVHCIYKSQTFQMALTLPHNFGIS